MACSTRCVAFLTALRALAREPRPPTPRARSARDVALLVVAGVISLAEPLVRDDVRWPIAAVFIGAVTTGALALRRAHPLASFVVVFGFAFAVDLASHLAGAHFAGLPSHAFALFLPHAVFRYGSGRELLSCGALMIAILATSLVDEDIRALEDAIGASVVFALPAIIGMTGRARARAEEQALANTRLSERTSLARELHDTVAHHVAAIAIQAQAGRAVVDRDPESAKAALRHIEGAAKDALRELREIVGALRDDEREERVGGPVDDWRGALTDLARGASTTTSLAFEGDVGALSPSVGRALTRIAREALTNISRHARDARSVEIVVDGRAKESIVMTIDDDGPRVAASTPGFGIAGMQERASLMGGTLTVGPRDDARGWRVRATLPRAKERA